KSESLGLGSGRVRLWRGRCCFLVQLFNIVIELPLAWGWALVVGVHFCCLPFCF
ncbi:unnamed protein product, partial [Amoebophrya sp. A25]